MIVAEIRTLKIRQDINVVAVPGFMLKSDPDLSYYFDFLNMPYIFEETPVPNINRLFYDIIAAKMFTNIKHDIENKEYVVLEKTNNCQKMQIKPQIYEKESLITINGIRADNVKIKVYSHDSESEVCEWVETDKEPQAFILYHISDYFGFLNNGKIISYEAFSVKGKGHYLMILPNIKENILQFGEEKVKVVFNNNELRREYL